MGVRPLNTDPTGQFALDANALSSLKQQARNDPQQAVGKAAGQFEALFLQMVLKQMRDALPQDGPLTSDTTRSYTAMFDQQLAQQLSARGVGLRKLIEQQLARHMGGAAPADGTTAPASTSGTSGSGTATPGASGTSKPVASASTATEKALAIAKSAAKAATATVAATTGGAIITGGVQGFLDKLRPHAEAVAQAMGVPAQYLLAQAGLETGWGKSLAHTGGQSSHNLFGIKAGANWKGAVVEAKTTEYVNGKAVQTVQRFRSYGSYTEAFQDFANLLKTNPRYANALAKTGNAKAYAEGLQRAGYATDPHYGAKLARSIDYVGRRLAQAEGGTAAVQVRAPTADNRSAAT